jgi:serine protease Do
MAVWRWSQRSPRRASGAPAADAEDDLSAVGQAAEAQGWWTVGAAAGAPPARPRRRRRALRTRIVAAAVAGLVLGAVGTAVAFPALRAAAQGVPVLTTVPVTPAQQAVDAPAVAVYRALSPSVVLVTNESTLQSYYGTQQQTGWGSGVVLSPNGYIVTNAHVVDGATSVTVTLANGQTYPARIVGTDDATDIAVIKISPRTPLKPAVFADSRDVVPGEFAVAIGNPLGPQFAQSVTVGVVSAIRPMLYGGTGSATAPRVTQMIQTDAPINPGNSGGALANAQGEVIGITSMKVAQTGEAGVSAAGLGFAIPSDTVLQIVNDLIHLGYVPRAWMGVAIDAAPSNALPSQPQTLTITEVDANGPAADAGIQVGDVLKTWDGKAITNYWQLVGFINAASPGQKVVLGLDRNGRTVDVTLTLGTLPRSLETAPAPSSQAVPPPSGGYPFPYPFPFPFPFPGGGNGGQ